MSRMMQSAAFAVGFLSIPYAFAQTDPGVRPGAVNGQAAATTTSPLPLASVTANTALVLSLKTSIDATANTIALTNSAVLTIKGQVDEWAPGDGHLVGIDEMVFNGADLRAQFLGLGRQLDRVKAKAEIHRCLTILR